MPKTYTYDGECKKLADHFIGDGDIPVCLVPDLAQAIQDAVDDFFARENRRSSTD